MSIFTSQAWGRSPHWMPSEEVNAFVDLCASAPSSMIESTLKDSHNTWRLKLLRNSNGKGETALSSALQYNSDPNVVNVLIKYEANPHIALELAIEEKNRGAVSALLAKFPDTLNELNFNSLCRVGPYKVIEDKLKNGAVPNAFGMGSIAPLHAAAEDNPDPAVVNLLIEYGAEPIAAKLMQHAALGGNINVIAALLKGGVPVDIQDKDGNTALMVAAPWSSLYVCCINFAPYPEERALEGINALLNAGANVNARSKKSGETALIRAVKSGRIETVKILINAGADVNLQGYENRTALMDAVNSRYPQPEVIIALLDAGANVNIKDRRGKRAIDYARENEKLAGTDAFLRLVKASQ